jgi:uncharacterized protein YcfJ
MNLKMTLGAAVICASMVGGLGLVHAQDYEPHHTRQVCHDVRIRDRASDNHRVAGTAIGAVAGGLLGHQVGGGNGKTLATVGGAVAGGYVGNRVQANHQREHASYHTERRCHEVNG